MDKIRFGTLAASRMYQARRQIDKRVKCIAPFNGSLVDITGKAIITKSSSYTPVYVTGSPFYPKWAQFISSNYGVLIHIDSTLANDFVVQYASQSSRTVWGRSGVQTSCFYFAPTNLGQGEIIVNGTTVKTSGSGQGTLSTVWWTITRKSGSLYVFKNTQLYWSSTSYSDLAFAPGGSLTIGTAPYDDSDIVSIGCIRILDGLGYNASTILVPTAPYTGYEAL